LTVIQAALRIYLGNFKCSTEADHILEMAGIGLSCVYRFINHICKIILLSLLKLIEPGLSDKGCKKDYYRRFKLKMFRRTGHSLLDDSASNGSASR